MQEQLILLNYRWRIALSHENPPYRQWLLQRSVLKGNETAWISQSYCQTRDALLTSIKEKIIYARKFYPGAISMPVDEDALAQVRELPDHI